MLADQAVRSSLGQQSMGRRRSKNHDLPPHMARKGMSYYYVCSSKPRRWIPLGSDLAKAKRLWAEYEHPIRQCELSVADLVQRYIDREDRPHSTVLQYNCYHRQIALAFPIPAAQLSSQHVALWRELLAQRARKAHTNGIIRLLLAAYRIGTELGLCSVLTVSKWATDKRDRIISRQEYRAIRDAATGWMQVAMDLGYLTGMRPSDIRALRWSAVGSTISVQQIKTKTRQEIAVQGDLASVLQQARQRPVLGLYVVATAKGRPVSRDVFSRAWLAACKAAGVTGAQFRDIRAMAAAASREEGQDYQALLGHSTQAMSDHYLRGRKVISAEPVRRKL